MRYSEQQASSELLDQPKFSGEPRKIFLCSTARSGSYMLCRYMINAGLGVPHEYFNPIIMRQIAPRFGLGEDVRRLKWLPPSRRDRLPFAKVSRPAEVDFLSKYLAILISRRCQRGIFAAKVHFDHYVKVLDNPVGSKLLDNGLFIHLYRDDLLAQAVSTRFANLTGRWSIDDTVTTVPADRPNFFSVAEIDRTLDVLTGQERGWRAFFGRNGIAPMSISYERLCADPIEIVAMIAEGIGIDPSTLRQGYSEVGLSSTNDSDLPSKHEVIAQYLAVGRKVRGLPAVTTRATQNPTSAEMPGSGK